MVKVLHSRGAGWGVGRVIVLIIADPGGKKINDHTLTAKMHSLILRGCIFLMISIISFVFSRKIQNPTQLGLTWDT